MKWFRKKKIQVIRISEEAVDEVIWESFMEIGDACFEHQRVDIHDDTEEDPVLIYSMLQDVETGDYGFALGDLYLNVDFKEIFATVPITANSLYDFSKERIYRNITHQGKEVKVIRISEEAANEVIWKALIERGDFWFKRKPLSVLNRIMRHKETKKYSMMRDEETGDCIFVLADKHLEIDFDKILKTVPITAQSLYFINFPKTTKPFYITV